jgi:hypothetical protein
MQIILCFQHPMIISTDALGHLRPIASRRLQCLLLNHSYHLFHFPVRYLYLGHSDSISLAHCSPQLLIVLDDTCYFNMRKVLMLHVLQTINAVIPLRSEVCAFDLLAIVLDVSVAPAGALFILH